MDSEVLTYTISWEQVYVADPLPQAYGMEEESFDNAINEATTMGLKAILMDEGNGQPDSIYVIDNSILQPYEKPVIQPPNYPLVSDTIEGLRILDDVPNTSSIESTLYNYEILEGIRLVPMNDFDINGKGYSVSENERTRGLVEEIRMSQTIAPLIVVVESDGPYILEGSHRVDALFLLGLSSFPALVVIDEDE